MSIVVDYAADPTLQATAAALGSGAAVANEQDWRERALAEQQYQFDQEYDWRVQQAALQDRLARSEMGNRTALGFGQLQSNNYNNQLDYMLGQQTLAQRDEQLGVEAALQSEQQQQLTNRAQMSQLGQIARQQQQQKFEAAMADRKAAEDWLRTASPRQAAQFRQRWEEKSGLSWNAPDEAMAAEDAQAQQDRIANIRRAFANPFNPEESLLPEGMEEWAMQLQPKELFDAAMKAQSEERQRQALSQKEGDADRKLEEQAAKDQQKEEAAAVKEATKTMRDSIAGEREWRQAQEEYSRDVQDYDEKMASYEAAKSAHAKMSAGGRGGTGATPRPFTQTPPQKPVPPTPGLFADKIPTPRSPEERDRLLPGTRYIDPAGNIRVRQ
jgi:hypothetical protein